jgi:hypothetical protein
VPYAAAAAVLALVVGLVVMLGSKNKTPAGPSGPTPTTPPPAATPAGPAKPSAPPYPPMPAAKLAEGQALVKTFDRDAAEADRLYKESLRAKEAGDDAAWQGRLKESRDLLNGIKDSWNEFLGTLPSNKDYDEEDVAKHYFYRESGLVAKATKLLAAMKSDER